jgi:hypothetical protein
MSTSDFELASPPGEPLERQLWLQHAAGFIFFEDARQYALTRIDPTLDDAAKDAARRAIDDALYGVMMIIDGVTGALRGPDLSVELQVLARLVRRVDGRRELVEELALQDGDGMCMGYHAWREGDFGTTPVATRAHKKASREARARSKPKPAP